MKFSIVSCNIENPEDYSDFYFVDYHSGSKNPYLSPWSRRIFNNKNEALEVVKKMMAKDNNRCFYFVGPKGGISHPVNGKSRTKQCKALHCYILKFMGKL